jgi:hypothetical protein
VDVKHKRAFIAKLVCHARDWATHVKHVRPRAQEGNAPRLERKLSSPSHGARKKLLVMKPRTVEQPTSDPVAIEKLWAGAPPDTGERTVGATIGWA